MKTKRLLLLLCICLFFDSVQAQTSECDCNCPATAAKPRMIVSDRDAELRSAAFDALKRRHLKKSFPNEIPLDLDSLKSIFAATKGNVSGIRIYFAQKNAKELSLVFALTTNTAPGIHTDDTSTYRILTFGIPTATLQPISKTKTLQYLKNYRDSFKKEIDTLPPLAGSTREETISLFYSDSTIKELYNAINTGCLKNIVKGVSIKWVAYQHGESITHDAVKKYVGDKLLFHFVFKDCNNFPIDFNNVCYPNRLIGDADTALPCPDFCNGGIH